MQRFKFAVLMLALFLVSIFTAQAADVTARIRGVVTDPSGAVVPNATLTATNIKTGVDYNAVSNSTGDYQFLQLPIGDYKLSAKAAGFQNFVATGITLSINQEYDEPVKLQIGNNSDTVEVQASAVQVDTTNIQLNNIVDAPQIVGLPLIGRNFTQLELLLPGVQAANDRFATFSANGSQTQQSSYLINGTDTNDVPLNTIVYVPSPDAIQQFNLITSSLNPEYARNSGAIVSATIKNGTNKFHGDAFEFYRDTFLNTHNYFQKTAPKFHQNLFGGTLGGPVWKDKAFFFLSYQGNRAVQPQAGGNVNVFNAGQLGGDFSADLTAKNPNVSKSLGGVGFSNNPIPGTISVPGCTAGQTWRQCLTTGKVPTSLFNPISVAFLQKYVPQPNNVTTLDPNGYLFNPTQQLVQDQGIGRFDFNATSKDQFFGVVVIQHAPSSRVLPFTGATLPGFGDTNTSEVHQYTASWSHVFSGTALNEFRMGYTRFNFGAVTPQQVVQPSSAGFAINSQFKAGAGLPFIGLSGLTSSSANFSLGFSTNGPQPRLDQTYQLDDNYSKVVGRHSLKFGFEGRRFNVNNPFYNQNNGSFGFAGNGLYSTGDGALDFLLGIPDTYGQGAGGRIDARAYESYVYGQDQWKLKENLTITAGAGWQVDTALHNRQFKGEGVTCFLPGQQSTVFPTAPIGLNYPSDRNCNDASGAKTAWKNVGPRIGFAYSPEFGWLTGGPGKTSIRGGYGIYFNRTEEEGSLQNLGDPPFGVNSSGASQFAQTASPAFANPFQDVNAGTTYPNAFPATFPQPGQAVSFAPFAPFSLSQYSPHYSIPSSQNFQLSIQRELPSNIVATISYVGALGRHEQAIYEGNPITQAGHDACLANPACSSSSGRRGAQSLNFPSHTAFGYAIPTNPNPTANVFPSIGTIDTIGSSNYNSFQASARKGTTHGLSFQASYTYSHSLDNASSFENSGFGGASRAFNQYNTSLNYGDSAFDARHRFVFAPVYEVPNFRGIRGLHWLPDVVGKGWVISGISTFATGFPFDIRQTGSNSLYCSGNVVFYACPDIPNQIAPLQRTDPRKGGNTAAFWFNPVGSFAPEVIGSFGNVHRNPFHGPGILNTDAALEKNVFFWPGNEDRYIQLRFESYNAFNHTQFNNPGGVFTTTSTFGKITSAAAGRVIQLGAKIYF